MKVVISGGSGDSFRLSGFLYRPREPKWSGVEVMAAWRRAVELSLGDEDTAEFTSIAQSRTEPASRVERARILLAYRSFLRHGRVTRPSSRFFFWRFVALQTTI